jgi:predicted alpha/beta superfamily hydrolase
MKRPFKLTGLILGVTLSAMFPSVRQTASGQIRAQEIVIGEKIDIHSKLLEEDRKILIGLPEDYRWSKQRYPVLYLLDGEFFFEQAAAAVRFLSELRYIRTQPIPQMIVVGIVNVDRNRDYTPTYAPKQAGGLEFPTSGKADKFSEFLQSELFPFIEARYRTQPYRILSGWSLGGLFTVYTYLENPDLFSAYIAMSPSLWWDGDLYVNRANSYLAKGLISDKTLVVTVGSQEGGNIGRTVRDGFIPDMKKKPATGKALRAVEIPDEGHNYVPYKAIYEGLKSVYSDWMMPGEVLQGGLEAIQSFYKNLSEKYGYRIDIPESAYFNLANYVYNQVSTEEAVKISKLYVDAYPESSFAHYRLGRFYHLMGDLESAIKFYRKAIALEMEAPDPDSERLVTYKINLKNAEKKLKSRTHGAAY